MTLTIETDLLPRVSVHDILDNRYSGEELLIFLDDPHTPPAVLLTLTDSPRYKELRLSLASHPSLCRDAAMRMADRALRPLDTALLGVLLSNPSVHPDVLSWALSSNYWDAPGLVASNPAITPELAEELLFDRLTTTKVLYLLAENPAMPQRMLRLLVAHESDAVRGAAAQNPSTPLHMVKKLLDDESPVARYAAYTAYKDRTERR